MKRPVKQWRQTAREWRKPDTVCPTRTYRLNERMRGWTWCRRKMRETAIGDTLRGIVRFAWDDMQGGGRGWIRVWG